MCSSRENDSRNLSVDLSTDAAVCLGIDAYFSSLANSYESIEEMEIIHPYSFHTMIKEGFAYSKTFHIVIIHFDIISLLTMRFGQEFTYQILHKMTKFMESSFVTDSQKEIKNIG